MQPLDEALGVLSKQLLHEPEVLWHRGSTTSALPPVGLSGSPAPHRVVLGSVPLAPVKAELNAPRDKHLESVAPVAFQGLLGELGIEIPGHSKYLSVLNT